MKILGICFFIISTMLVGFVASLGFAAGGVEWLDFKRELDGLVLRASLRDADVAWKDMVVRLEVANSSAKNIKYVVANQISGFRLSLANQKNEDVPLTELGKALMRDCVDFGRRVREELLPGRQLKDQIKLSDFFMLTKPDVYKLSVGWDQFPNPAAQCIRIEIREIRFKASRRSWFSRELTISLIENPETHH